MSRSILSLIFIAIVGAVTATAYLALPWMVGWLARDYLADRGFPDASLTVESVGLTEAVIDRIDFGGDSNIRARKLSVAYSPGRLSQGIIDGLTVAQPELPLSVGVAGIDLGKLQPFFEDRTSDTENTAGGVRLIGPVTVTAGLLNVATPLGDVVAAIEGVVLLTDGIGTDANFEFALQHPKAQVGGRLHAILDSSEQLQLTLDIQNASSDARVAFEEMAGAVNIRGQIAGALEGGGSLTLQDVHIDGIQLGNVDLVGQINGKAARGEFLMGGTGTGLSMQVRAETEDVFDPATKLHLYGEAATDGLKGPYKLPIDIDVVGAMEFDLTGSRRDLQALPGQIATGAVRAMDGISGVLDLTHLGLAAPNGVDATLDGKLQLAVDRQGWRMRPVSGLHFDLGLPSGGTERRFELSLGNIADVPFVAGGPTAADPLRLGAVFDGVFNDWFPFSGDAGGTVWPATTDGVVFEDLALRFDPWQMRLGGLEVVAEQIGVRLSGPFRQLDMDVSAEARFSGRPAAGILINGGQVSLAGNIGYGDDGIRIYPDGCMELRASDMDIQGTQLRPGPVAVCPRADGGPVLHAVVGDAGLKRIDLAAVLKSTEIALEGAGPYPLSGTLPRFDGTASLDAERGTWWAKLASMGGDIRAEGPDIALADVRAEISLEGRESLLGARIDLTSAVLADKQRPLRMQPLSIKGKGTYQPSALAFDGSAGFTQGPSVNIDARYRVPDRRGALQLRLPVWNFKTDGVQPQTLLPALKGVIAEVSGGFGAEARVGWTGARMSSTAKLHFNDVAFGTSPAEVAGVSGDIVFSDLVTLKTDASQTLKVGLLDAGLPLRNGVIVFDLPGNDSLHIDSASWPVVGGTLDIKELSIPFDRPPDVFVANLKGLDASALARSMDIDGLEADGTLAGSIPIRINEDGPVIDDARIWSNRRGVLRFRSKVALESLKQSGEMAELLSRALADFRYTELQVSMDGPLSGEITAKAKLSGANPALYDGRRIELNVSLQGALRDLLQSASLIQDLPGNFLDSVQRPSGKP